jgi:hypothetical protein
MQSSCWNFGKEAHRRTVECYKLARWLDLHAVMKREGEDGAYPAGWIVTTRDIDGAWRPVLGQRGGDWALERPASGELSIASFRQKVLVI